MTFEIPNLRHLRVFLEVVRSKSISAASEKVFLSQPAITQAICKLENQLEVKLFKRRSDGMYATKEGEIFAHRVERALDLIVMGLREVMKVEGRQDKRADKLLIMLSTTQLRSLIAVSEARNYSVAARKIGVSQSSLHRASKKLAEQLEVVLFEKTSTGINPSKAARILARSSTLAFSEILQGRDEVLALRKSDAGTLVIGGMPLVQASILPNVINRFTEKYPGFRIKISDGSYSDLLYHLRQGNIDFLLGALRLPVPTDDIVQEELFLSPVAVVVRPDHPLLSKRNISIHDLAACSWVVPREGAPTRIIFEKEFQSASLAAPKRLMEATSQLLLRSIIAGSDRLTMISEHQIKHELDSGVLKTLHYPIKDGARPIGITFRKNWQPTSSQNIFIEMLRECRKKIGIKN